MGGRHEARSRGFSGGLREDLAADSTGFISTARGSPELSSAVGALLPGTKVELTSSAGPVRRLLQRAVSGSGAQLRVDISDEWGRFSVRAPESSDLMLEVIAMAADTAMAIKIRFGRELRHVDRLSFDLAVHGMSQNKVRGAASREVPQIHLSAILGCATGLDRAVTHRPLPSATGPCGDECPVPRGQGDRPRVRPPVRLRFPSPSISGQHRVPPAVGACAGRRVLGGSGRGGQRGADNRTSRPGGAWPTTFLLNATTSIAEAMAELFAVWWFGDEHSPDVVKCFGDLIEEYFPAGR